MTPSNHIPTTGLDGSDFTTPYTELPMVDSVFEGTEVGVVVTGLGCAGFSVIQGRVVEAATSTKILFEGFNGQKEDRMTLRAMTFHSYMTIWAFHGVILW